MKIYVSGKISGLEMYANIERMHLTVAEYRKSRPDMEFVNPLEVGGEEGTWEAAMRKDIAALCECDGILMLPGWTASPGAQLEMHVASRLGMPVFLALAELPRQEA